jgi:hypothetical protein
LLVSHLQNFYKEYDGFIDEVKSEKDLAEAFNKLVKNKEQ